MSFFKRKEIEQNNTGTTIGFYLGSPEAEGENKSEKQNLVAFFEDYMDIQNQILDGKFIISGRKGSGKSAFVKYVLDNSGEQQELFSSLIKPSEFDLEKLIQTLPSNIENKYEILFEWIILTRFVQLILKSNCATYTREYKSLEQFYKKNSGVIEIDKYVTSEITTNNQAEVNLNPLKGIFSTTLSKFFSNKLVKAPFFQFIPSLREIVIQILNFDVYANIDFILLFDDLDIKFKLSREQDKIKLLDLIRLTKRYNNEYLKKTKGRILIFLRDDIGKRLDGIDSDKNKIFGSYEYKINWYNYESGSMQEKDILLRKFINKRIGINFQTMNIPYNIIDPWLTLVDNNVHPDYNRKTAFRYILDFTFYRPRDFVNIFKNIGSCNYSIPLNPNSIKALLKQFVQTNVGEIKDELTVLFDASSIENIFSLLNQIARTSNLSYTALLELMDDYNIDRSNFVILLDYCLIIPKDTMGYQYFNYREQPLLNNYEDYVYTLPKCLYTYFVPGAI